MQNRKINLEIYLDRNEVHREDAKKSGMFWHRDRVTTNNGSLYLDYYMMFLEIIKRESSLEVDLEQAYAEANHFVKTNRLG